MTTKSSPHARAAQDRESHLKAVTDSEHEMVAERLNLIRTMSRNISAPDLIDRQAVAFVNVQNRLNELRAQRSTLEQQHEKG